MSLTQRIAMVYDFEQVTPALVWTITHNLGGYPIVDAYITYDGDLQRINPASVTYVNPSTCTVSFTTPQAGFASVA